MNYALPSFRARRMTGAVVTVAQGLSADAIRARAEVCIPCAWNRGDRCQHIGQNCPPCKQGQSLARARATAHFKCPLNLFPKPV